VYTGLSINYCKSLIFFITDRDCVALPNVDISTSAPPMDEVAVVCPPACNNNDARGRAIYVGAVFDPGGGTTYACSSPPLGRRATADAAVGLMQAVLAFERLSPLPSRTLRPVFVQDDVRTAQFSMATTTYTSTSATLATRGYHLHVVLAGFYSSHSIRAIMTLQLQGDVSSSDFTFDLLLTVCGAPAVTAGGC
jgi:hypothetical protein